MEENKSGPFRINGPFSGPFPSVDQMLDQEEKARMMWLTFDSLDKHIQNTSSAMTFPEAPVVF